MTPSFSPVDGWRIAAREVWLPTAAEMSDLDRRAIESGAIPERALIENAGRALASLVHERAPEGRVLVLAGSGHNGADALVAGRTLAAWGRDVAFVQGGGRVPEPDVLGGWPFELEPSEALEARLTESAVVIDGLLGTGIETAPRPPQAALIEQLNRSRAYVVACDGPSGVDFTSGAVPGVAVRADLTVTFGWPKIGLLRFPAREHCGELVSVEIGFPPPDPPPQARAITAAWAQALVGERGSDTHKGQAGYLAIVGGRAGMAGAAILAARAAIRCGAGIVRVVSAPGNRETVQTAVPEAIFVPWDEPEAVEETCAWADAVAIGPGLGVGHDQAALVRTVLERRTGPAVIDADALHVLGDSVNPVSLGSDCLITPHPGEMAQLLLRSIEEVKADPIAVATDTAASLGCTVLLKGAPSWVATPAGDVRATTLLSAAFGTGGMGDVLAGACGAYAASGLPVEDAATAALMVTALAVHERVDEVGGSAADVPDAIPAGREALGEARPGAWAGVGLALPASTATS